MPESTTRTTSTAGGRTVVGLMVVAVLFSLVGKSTGKGSAAKIALSDAQIIIGGGFATAILVLASHAGDSGRELATGMALVVLASSALVYGGPVWGLVSEVIGVGHGPTATTGATLGTGTTGTPTPIPPAHGGPNPTNPYLTGAAA